MRMVSASISAGGVRRRVGRFMVPDGLHIWIGSRGVLKIAVACHKQGRSGLNGVWDKTGTTRTSSSPRSSGWPSAAVAFSVPGSRPCHRHTSCATTMGGGSARSGRATTAVRGGGSSTASHTGSRRSARRTPDGASRPIPKEAGS